LSACRARIARATLDWIAAARRSGVNGSPALVIGGRIYPGLNDEATIRQLIDAELAPGVLDRCATTGC
jgi:protein-disulfide isomerase